MEFMSELEKCTSQKAGQRSSDRGSMFGRPVLHLVMSLFLYLIIVVGTFPAFTVALDLSNFERMACDHGHGTYPELNYGSGTKWIKNLTRDRLGGFNGGRYSELNLASVLYTQRLDKPEYVKLKV